MALTATDTVGFERSYNLSGFHGNAVDYEGSTGTTYTKGQLAYLSSGLLATVTSTIQPDYSKPIVGVIAETITTTDTDKDVKVYPIKDEVYTVTFTGQWDVGCDGSTASNQFKCDVSSTGSTAANLLTGALIYIYDGPGEGDARTILTNTAADPCVITVSGAFSATPSTLSSAIVLATYSTATSAITADTACNVGSQLKLSTAGAGKVAIAPPTYAEGYVNVLGIDPENLKMRVTLSNPKTVSGIGRSTT